MSTSEAPGRGPRLYGGSDTPRSSTWLELFFDLAFVVAVARLAALLHDDPTGRGFAVYLGLFVPVWWLWISFSYYADLFDTHDFVNKLSQLAAMLGAIVIAITLEEGVGDDARLFAGTFAVLFVLLAALYANAGRNEPVAAELCRYYVVGSLTGAALWAGSLAVPAPGRYWVWALAVLLNASISGPIAYLRVTEAPQQVSHMPERFGLFVVIVLGESVLAVVEGTTGAEWNPASTAVAVFAFVLVVSMWWVYFSQFEERLIDRALSEGSAAQERSFVYGYGHLFLYALIAAAGIGMELAIEEAAEGLAGEGTRLLWTSLAGYLLLLTGMQAAVGQAIGNRVLAARAVAAAVCLLLAVARPAAVVGVAAATVALLVVVGAEVAGVRARERDPEAQSATA